MTLNCVSLCAGDQGYGLAYRSAHADLSPSDFALAMVSGDNFFMTRPGVLYPGPVPEQIVRPSVPMESRRVNGGGRSSARFIKGREPHGRNRGRQGRFSPYPAPAVKLDLLRSVLQQRLRAHGGVVVARIPA
ncbi:uncharacterized protein C11orf71 homolog [Orycteropus afer afer]|uniref:Uncharacterized protein C11orf71 homolog n=1 Tax=Orycteropus afer afer TaxID=1230840 RepID=A0A8B6ZI64_ORYAF|nr:uncharacterized protein C11orf71 homolog [Orycteropus afer afer]